MEGCRARSWRPVGEGKSSPGQLGKKKKHKPSRLESKK